MSSLPKDYLQKEYELRLSYFKDHLTRMWTRFNFFLVINTGPLVRWFKPVIIGRYRKKLLDSINCPEVGQYSRANYWPAIKAKTIKENYHVKV